MAVVNIPAAMRSTTKGETRAEIPGATLADAIDSLEVTYPGIKARLVEGDRIRPGLAAFVDGVQASAGLRTRLSESSEVYFAPAIAGG
jgi:molybdopterin synthase sulfur carrier subunit